VSAAVNVTDYALSNFDRIELRGKDDFSYTELNIELRVNLIASLQ